MRISEVGSLWLMGGLAVATLGGVLMTSAAKKEAQARQAVPSFDDRLAALDSKPSS